MKIKPKSYIIWSTNREIDLDNPIQKKFYIKNILMYGLAEDISKLDFDYVEKVLPELDLPKEIRSLWENYFNASK